MPVFHEGRRLSDWLKGETQDPTRFCRDQITVLAGETLVTGAVLGKITASGKYVACDPSSTDGSEDAVAILVTDSIEGDTTADAEAVALTRGPATIVSSKLTFLDGTTDNEQATMVAALLVLGIVAREAA